MKKMLLLVCTLMIISCMQPANLSKGLTLNIDNGLNFYFTKTRSIFRRKINFDDFAINNDKKEYVYLIDPFRGTYIIPFEIKINSDELQHKMYYNEKYYFHIKSSNADRYIGNFTIYPTNPDDKFKEIKKFDKDLCRIEFELH